MDFDTEMSIKRLCLRGYEDNATVAEKLKACGVDNSVPALTECVARMRSIFANL